MYPPTPRASPLPRETPLETESPSLVAQKKIVSHFELKATGLEPNCLLSHEAYLTRLSYGMEISASLTFLPSETRPANSSRLQRLPLI